MAEYTDPFDDIGATIGTVGTAHHDTSTADISGEFVSSRLFDTYIFDRARSGRSSIPSLEGDNLKAGYSVEDLFAQAGLYLTPNSEIKVWRAMIGLPSTNLSTGFLDINSDFIFATKVQKWNFNTEGSGAGTEADNSPAYLGDYEIWSAWKSSPSGYSAVTYTGYEDYRDFYDWFDSEFSYLGITGTDTNVQQRYHLVDPVSPSYADGTINQWVNYPYVSQSRLQAYLDEDMNNFSNSIYVPDFNEDGFFGGTMPWDSSSSPTEGLWFGPGGDSGALSYSEASLYKTPYTYYYETLENAIAAKFITKDIMRTRHLEFVNHACESLVTQKLITSQRFSGARQAAIKIKMSNLSAIGNPAVTETLLDRGEASAPSTTATYTSTTY